MNLDLDFDKIRDQLLNETRTLTPGKKAIESLIKLRKDYEIKVPGYRNSLKILSDTTYKDRKHFLLELIQNADDATYLCASPKLEFTIFEDYIELAYNEEGFSVEDVIAITDTGNSTKKLDKINSNNFIGEKGIGFKSVFALASEVEIESFPWHFKLSSDTIIVPEIIEKDDLLKGDGTRIKIKFKDKVSIDIIAQELYRFVKGDIESFLFLQKISGFTLVDKRDGNNKFSIIIEPKVRTGKKLSIKTEPENEIRKYVLYSEEITFEKDLVTTRWENMECNSDYIKRNISVAALINSKDKEVNTGRVFCYLPTEITLPLPIFLQFDGHLTADRGRLHDIENNKWNKKIISYLPIFLVNAILNWRNDAVISKRLVDYIPTGVGQDQLSWVISKFKEKLMEAPWIKTNHEEEQWVIPSKAIIADEYFIKIFKEYPDYMMKVENFLDKKFVDFRWCSNSKWKDVISSSYDIPSFDIYLIIDALANLSMPSKFLNEDEKLTGLYKYIHERLPSRRNARESLSYAKIFPVKINRRNSFNSLKHNQDDKVFYLSSKKEFDFDVDDNIIKYNIINPSYTYIPVISKNLSEIKMKKEKAIKERNEALLSIIKMLSIEELTDLTLLKEVLIPSITEETDETSDEYSEEKYVQKINLLKSIFNLFLNNVDNKDFKKGLGVLSNCYLFSEKNQKIILYNLTIPKNFRFEEDYLYDGINADILKVTDSLEEELKDSKKEFREFLLLCGITNKPRFYTASYSYDDYYDLNHNNGEISKELIRKIRTEITRGREIKVTKIEFDDISIELLNSEYARSEMLASSIYTNWVEKYKDIDVDDKNDWKCEKLIPGYCTVCYFYHRERQIKIVDELWSGVKKNKIPVKLYSGKIVYSNEAIQCSKIKNPIFSELFEKLSVVIEDDKENGYNSKYLDSLNIRKIRLDDLNTLWNKVDEEQYINILKLAIELLNNGYEKENFKILDKRTNDLKKCEDFRIGEMVNRNIPSISKQYGVTGEKLGKMLNLKEESAAKAYGDIFEKIIIMNEEIPSEEIHRFINMLMSWNKWNPKDRADLIKKLKERCKLLNINNKPVLINELEGDEMLIDNNIFYIQVPLQDEEFYEIEEAAKELGFVNIEDIGQLVIKGEKSLIQSEIEGLKFYISNYKNDFNPKEKGKFHGLFNVCGGIENLYESIKKVKELVRKISKDSEIEIKLPYIDSEQGIILLSDELNIEQIAIDVLTLMEAGREKNIIADIKEISKLLKLHVKDNRIPNIENKDSVDDIRPNLENIKNEVRESLTDNRSRSENRKSNNLWKTGPMPEEEEKIRRNIYTRIHETMDSNPETYIKTLQKNKIVYDEKFLIEAKEFLKNEYSGKCQICHQELHLHNGNSYINIFRIKEAKNRNWWANSPFNVLGLCPNCHAVAKHGGDRDFKNIYEGAMKLIKGDLFPEEVEDFNGDYYVLYILMNGENKSLVMSKLHLNFFAALFKEEEIKSEIASTVEE